MKKYHYDMVIVNRRGRLGNVLFQYTFGRIIADSTGMSLHKNFSYGNMKEIINVPGKTKPVTLVVKDCEEFEGKIIDLKHVFMHDGGMFIDGFFQHKSYYENRRNQIKSWLFDQKITKQNTVGIHLRFGDYKEINWTLPEEYYDSCIVDSNMSNILIFTDEQQHPYVQKLLKKGASLSGMSEEEDLKELASCQKIIMSRSSFSWWAAFLSNAEKVYFPRPKNGFWSIQDTPHKDLYINNPEYFEVIV